MITQPEANQNNNGCFHSGRIEPSVSVRTGSYGSSSWGGVLDG